MARIIAFEGPDKVGKETQSKLATEALTRRGSRAVRVEVPSRHCPRTHALIYRMLRNGWAKRMPNLFQFVQFLNKLIFQLTVLPALLRAYDFVIFDRWSLSAIVYGNATGVNPTFNALMCGLLRQADLTLVFAERSFRRSTTVDDAYERDNELQARVKAHYRVVGLTWPKTFLIGNDRGIDEIHGDVMEAVLRDGGVACATR